jgi:D-amino peptidase
MLVNGKPVGEIETVAALAGYYGTPVIMLSGDRAAADNLGAIVPKAELPIVKEGLANYDCIIFTLSAKAAQELIQQKAQKAIENLGTTRPYKIEGPRHISDRAHFSQERNHQGKSNVLLFPTAAPLEPGR